ncbi:MAG: hypothetical protein JST85_28920 [Acidobacteria bacterium]|nr:hypothetical protein [Acidobacteriota bacterium]
MNNSDDNALRLKVDIWKHTVSAQHHFNELELKVRSLAVTLLAAELGAAGLAKGVVINIAPYWILAGALMSWLSCYVMDRFWYHRLLCGAVAHGEAIEKELQDLIKCITLTTTISNEIRHGTVRARRWMDIFYLGVGAVLLLLIVISLIGKGTST